ncbi:MFS transporter [Caenimonas koreensis DSM 17982]|uniref:MFS transporter n=1 Tax=Caenimonas koreensis DSM 17982 TaxID=1121255 RepID=A0A844B9Y8_9BURK|nr:MFS transporter [Caenimonas koreensis]MRD48419.1 MFS transporter [Caenimonas koreensis DSM 17982]
MTTPRLPGVLWPLLFGNFVIGTGVMIVPGTLNEISTSLVVSPATAGQLISAGALLMCITAPLVAALVAGWDRRRLLALSMLWYGLLHIACTAAPSFAALLPLRVLSMIAPAIFTPQAAACIGLLVPADQRGRAITFVFLGWSVASVLGMPMGALIGGTFGWQAAFGAVGILSLASGVWVWRSMPDGVKPPALSVAAWHETFRSPALMLCILVTVLYSAGQFVLFSYFAPYFKFKVGITAVELSAFFMWFGLFGFIGNAVMSRQIDRVGASRSVMIGIVAMSLTFLVWPLGTSIMLAGVIAIPWALGCFSSNSAQQARLVGIAPALASASIALNTSAMYAGQAVGAGAGGWLIAHDGMETLHWAALAFLVVAMACSAWATRHDKLRLAVR